MLGSKAAIQVGAWKDLEVLPDEDFPGQGDWSAASKPGKKGLEVNKDAVSDADVEPFRASQGGRGWTDDHPVLRAGAERGGPCRTPGKRQP